MIVDPRLLSSQLWKRVLPCESIPFFVQATILGRCHFVQWKLIIIFWLELYLAFYFSIYLGARRAS